MVKRFLFSIVFVFSTTHVFADFWEDAKIIVTYSKNKEYMLIVYPIEYPNNFFTRKYQRQYRKGFVKDTIKPCHAILYHIFNADTTKIWNQPLVNYVSPVGVIVANDGKSVITFNEWEMAGNQHTMVIYGESGKLLKDFCLKEISPFPLEQYPRSISSIYWGNHWEYLDNDRIEITFCDKNDKMIKRIYNIKKEAFE